ncbi:MAG: hypothetical protein ACRDGN_03500 [bacterium]
MTDLVNPRQAYFQRMRPDVQPAPDRLQAMMAGTGFHDVFERAMSTEEFVEQLVEFEGIVGKIDIFEQAPVELKTTMGSMPSDILATRASHAEQLAMYCVMVGKPAGHLVYYQRAEYGRTPALRAFDLEVTDPDPIAREMVRRRDLLREALDRRDPTGLPRCEWAGRGCDYEAICGCETAAPLTRMATPGSLSVRGNAELDGLLRERIGAAEARADGRNVRLHDLVVPRRAAYELAAGGEPGEAREEDAESRMKSLERMGFEGVLKESIWYAVPGACRRIRVPFGSVQASILLYRDVPTIIRVTGRSEMYRRDRLIADAPHYVDRLAFECALAGSERGRLIAYYSSLPDDKFMVYDIWFRDLDAIKAEMQRRLDLLDAGAPPDELPACQPGWFAKFCPYAPGCGCDSQDGLVRPGRADAEGRLGG